MLSCTHFYLYLLHKVLTVESASQSTLLTFLTHRGLGLHRDLQASLLYYLPKLYSFNFHLFSSQLPIPTAPLIPLKCISYPLHSPQNIQSSTFSSWNPILVFKSFLNPHLDLDTRNSLNGVFGEKRVVVRYSRSCYQMFSGKKCVCDISN